MERNTEIVRSHNTPAKIRSPACVSTEGRLLGSWLVKETHRLTKSGELEALVINHCPATHGLAGVDIPNGIVTIISAVADIPKHEDQVGTAEL